jgi:O-antigen ligase
MMIVSVAALAACVLIAQYRYLGFEEKFGAVVRLGRMASAPFPQLSGLQVRQNAAATFLEAALPLAVALALAQTGAARLLAGGGAAAIAWAVLLTGSRGAWVALIAAAGLSGLVLLRILSSEQLGHVRRPKVLLLVLALAAVGILLISAANWRRWLASAAQRASDRGALYHNSLFLALDFPLTGIGPGATFGMVYSRFQLLIPDFYLSYAHNLLLDIWLAQGLLGLLSFGGLLLASGRLVWRGLLYGQRGPSHSVGWGATVGCTTVLLHGLTDAPQYDDAWYALLMIFAVFGVMVAAACRADDRPLRWMQPGKSTWLIGVVVAVAAVAFGGRELLALASANVANVLQARSALALHLTNSERDQLHARAITWADRGLRLSHSSAAAQKSRGMLAFDLSEHNFDLAIELLEPALRASPADLSLRKALGYAYIWQGRITEGVAMLESVGRIGEIVGELQAWPYAWRERGRPDLAAQAERAAAAILKQSTP